MAFIVKNTTFPNPLDLIAPHNCRGCGQLGSPLCEKCKNYIISHHQNYCPLCKNPKTETPYLYSASTNELLSPAHPEAKVVNYNEAKSTGTDTKPTAGFKTNAPISPFAHLDLPTSLLCPHCPQLPHTFTIDSRNRLIGQLIHDFKYQSVRALALPLADLLHQTFPELTGPAIIVPLPTISRHIRERGLDHIYLIAKHFAKLRGTHYKVEKLLLRAQNTVQVGADKASRTTQAQKAYKLAPHAKIDPNATYILLDDVWTTGASMQAAYQTLLSADAFTDTSCNNPSNSKNITPKIILATLAVSINEPS